jgi:hypothetical protein
MYVDILVMVVDLYKDRNVPQWSKRRGADPYKAGELTHHVSVSQNYSVIAHTWVYALKAANKFMPGV